MAGAIKNLGDCLRLPAMQDQTAFIDLLDPDRPVQFTARELNDRIDAAASGFRKLGIKKSERIAILSRNRVEFLLCYFGAMRIGAVAVPINFKLPPGTIAHILRDSNCRLAVCEQQFAHLLPHDIERIFINSDIQKSTTPPFDAISHELFSPKADDLAEILYTSGSTGLPKGVPLTHSGQLWALDKYLAPIGNAKNLGVTLIAAPLYHMNGLFFSTVALANRMTIVSLSRFRAEEYLKAIAQFKCTYLTGVPSMFALAARVKNKPDPKELACVQNIKVGSAPLSQTLIEQIRSVFANAEISNGYGTTEAGPAVFGPHPDGLPQPPTSVGYPLSDVEWRFENGAADEGPLELRTPALARQYLNLPEATSAKFAEGWYKTGDIMRRDENGLFYFVGRIDDMFVCGGENIYPGEVETLLERHPGVAQAAIVSAPDDIKGAIPVAFIVPAKSATGLTEEAVKAFALKNGPSYAHPRIVIFKKSFPLGGTHKIDKRALEVEARRAAIERNRSHAPQL